MIVGSERGQSSCRSSVQWINTELFHFIMHTHTHTKTVANGGGFSFTNARILFPAPKTLNYSNVDIGRTHGTLVTI